MKKAVVRHKSVSTPDARALSAKAAMFTKIYNRVVSHPVRGEAVWKQAQTAVFTWATLKMGDQHEKYWEAAYKTFKVLCTLHVAQTGKSIEEALNETPLQLPLDVDKKRLSFIEQLPDLFQMLEDYKRVHAIVELAKSRAKTSVHFRFVLRERLPKPLPASFEKTLENYYLSTTPSEITFYYLGCQRGMSGANIKKLRRLVLNGERMFKQLEKDLRKRYLPPKIVATIERKL